MFRRITKPLQNFASTIKQSTAKFCLIQKPPPSQPNINLLLPFNRGNTLEVLKQHQNGPSYLDFNNFYIIKNLTVTPYSETYLVFNDKTDETMALKNLKLESPRSWEQINLILRQNVLSKKPLAYVFDINYNEETQEVNILSECQKTILTDFSQLKKELNVPWTGEELTILSWQLLHQFNTMKQLGASCSDNEAIDPNNMFIDESNKLLKLHDFADFRLSQEKSPHSSLNNLPPFMSSMVLSLVKIINPSAKVNNFEEARDYLASSYPDYMYHLEMIEVKLRDLDYEHSANFSEKLESEILQNLLIISKEYNPKQNEAQPCYSENPHNKRPECINESKEATKEPHLGYDLKLKEAYNHFEKALKAVENSTFKDKDKLVQLLSEFEMVLKELTPGKNVNIPENLNTRDKSAHEKEKLEHQTKIRSEDNVEKHANNIGSPIIVLLKKIWEILNLKTVIGGSLLFTLFFTLAVLLLVIVETIASFVEKSAFSPDEAPNDPPGELPSHNVEQNEKVVNKINEKEKKEEKINSIRLCLMLLLFYLISLIG